ncbi:hypothetical protein M514_15411, partial [Trichuris suis]
VLCMRMALGDNQRPPHAASGLPPVDTANRRNQLLYDQPTALHYRPARPSSDHNEAAAAAARSSTTTTRSIGTAPLGK